MLPESCSDGGCEPAGDAEPAPLLSSSHQGSYFPIQVTRGQDTQFQFIQPNKRNKMNNAVNHSHFNRSSVVWSHDAHPPNVVLPSFERSTFFCTLYNATPWRSAQLVFYSECQFHQSLDSSLQQSGIFSVHLFFHSIFTWHGNACCWSVGAAIRSPCFLLQCILKAFFVGEILGQSSHL